MSSGKLSVIFFHKNPQSVRVACHTRFFEKSLTPFHLLKSQALVRVISRKENNGGNEQQYATDLNAGQKTNPGKSAKNIYLKKLNWHMQLTGKKIGQHWLFPPVKGGGEDVDYGYKNKGATIHSLTNGQDMS